MPCAGRSDRPRPAVRPRGTPRAALVMFFLFHEPSQLRRQRRARRRRQRLTQHFARVLLHQLREPLLSNRGDPEPLIHAEAMVDHRAGERRQQILAIVMVISLAVSVGVGSVAVTIWWVYAGRAKIARLMMAVSRIAASGKMSPPSVRGTNGGERARAAMPARLNRGHDRVRARITTSCPSRALLRGTARPAALYRKLHHVNETKPRISTLGRDPMNKR